MEVGLHLLPFEEYQDLCMCLFYNESIPLASFLPVHKLFLEENILQGLFWFSRCWLWIDHRNSDLALRPHPASTTFYFWMFHNTSGRYFTAQYSKEGRRYLVSSIISVCYKSAASFRKVITHLSMGCRSHFEHLLCESLNSGFWKREKGKSTKNRSPIQIRKGLDTDH